MTLIFLCPFSFTSFAVIFKEDYLFFDWFYAFSILFYIFNFFLMSVLQFCLATFLRNSPSLSCNPWLLRNFKQTIEAHEYHHIKFNASYERRFERWNLQLNFFKIRFLKWGWAIENIKFSPRYSCEMFACFLTYVCLATVVFRKFFYHFPSSPCNHQHGETFKQTIEAKNIIRRK